MAALKTKPNDLSVEDFLAGIGDKTKRAECREIAAMMEAAVGCKPRMWGESIVGFGRYHFKYKSGREGDWFRIGFSPRVQNITLYIMDGFRRYDELMGRLGKHSNGKSCLYIKRLSEVDRSVLKDLIIESVGHFEKKYGPNVER